jgi:hypothetical protein
MTSEQHLNDEPHWICYGVEFVKDGAKSIMAHEYGFACLFPPGNEVISHEPLDLIVEGNTDPTCSSIVTIRLWRRGTPPVLIWEHHLNRLNVPKLDDVRPVYLQSSPRRSGEPHE